MARQQRSSLLPIIIGSGIFTVLLAGVIIVSNNTYRADDAGQQVDQENQRSQVSAVPVKTVPVKLVAVAEPVNDSPKNVAVDLRQARLEQVRAHLAAGEFGPAMDVADSEKTAAEKTVLLKEIAAAQMKTGEFQPALATIRRIPLREERSVARGKHAVQSASAGGGNGADFGQLKDLIESVTSGGRSNGKWASAGDEDGGSMDELLNGVRVDPNGLLSYLTREELSSRLATLGFQARRADINQEMSRASSLRIVSLTRLEREIQRRISQGQPVVETMKNLAGLHKIDYVFVVPESGEILIGGPAEGWRYNQKGQPVGNKTGKPTLQLDDFVTVFRTFSRNGHGIFQCTINPRKKGLQAARAVNEKVTRQGGLKSNSAAARRNFVNALNKAMGLQDVVVNGIPAESRVARVIVNADYRMKLIGIDKLQGAKISSYFDLLQKTPQKKAPSVNALRWWLTMKYDSILHSKDRHVFQLKGSSVWCQGLNEKITPDGRRIHTGKADACNLQFAKQFTNRYAQLAQDDLAFADLQNVFDLSLVAALLQQEQITRRVGWNGGLFAMGGQYRPARLAPIKTVHSVSNHRVYNGRNVVVQIAGGVRGDIMSVVRNKKVRQESAQLGGLLKDARAPKLPAGRWWWDVKK